MLISNSFALYDNSTMDSDYDRENSGIDPVPWLDIDSIVVDESDLKTGEHWRKLHLVVTHVESGRVFSSLDDPATPNSSICDSPLRTPPPRNTPATHTIASWLGGYHSSTTSSTSGYAGGHAAHLGQQDEDSSLSNLSAALSAASKDKDCTLKES